MNTRVVIKAKVIKAFLNNFLKSMELTTKLAENAKKKKPRHSR